MFSTAVIPDFTKKHWIPLATSASVVAVAFYWLVTYNPVESEKQRKRKQDGGEEKPWWLPEIEASKSLNSPLAVVDLDAFERNVTKGVNAIINNNNDNSNINNENKKNIRVATKSIRCVELISRFVRMIPQDRFAGLMCFSAEEVLQLAKLAVPALSLSSSRGGNVGGSSNVINTSRLPSRVKHLLLAYPIMDEAAARKLVAATELVPGEQELTVAVMVDCVEQVELLARVDPKRRLKLWIDIDMAWRVIGEDSPLLYVGARRSPLGGVAQVVRLAQAIVGEFKFTLEGVMGYEGQIAGLPDSLPASGIPYIFRRMVKRGAEEGVRDRRKKVVDALNAAIITTTTATKNTSSSSSSSSLICNGGGSGSVKFTMQDPAVTEITLGSAALCGHQFDGYIDEPLYEPALYFVLRATRQPRSDILTCHGGGWIASGDPGSQRLPLIHWPAGAQLLPMEGAGEVQTPVDVSKCGAASAEAQKFKVGDLFVFRHCKSGELGEVFATYNLVSLRNNKSPSSVASSTSSSPSSPPRPSSPPLLQQESGTGGWEVVYTYRGQGINSW